MPWAISRRVWSVASRRSYCATKSHCADSSKMDPEQETNLELGVARVPHWEDLPWEIDSEGPHLLVHERRDAAPCSNVPLVDSSRHTWANQRCLHKAGFTFGMPLIRWRKILVHSINLWRCLIRWVFIAAGNSLQKIKGNYVFPYNCMWFGWWLCWCSPCPSLCFYLFPCQPPRRAAGPSTETRSGSPRTLGPPQSSRWCPYSVDFVAEMLSNRGFLWFLSFFDRRFY